LIARLALKRGGWRVDVAGSGAEALIAVATSPPDLVLLDVMLDGERGTELRKKLPPDLPVIFLTARADLADADAAGVIGKPFDPSSLPDLIEEIWRAQSGSGVVATG
jgi:DNA-binding response OmpR family regulator